MAKNHVWYVCPACRSRLAVERHHDGEVRCLNCSMLLRPAKDGASATKQAIPAAGAEDEYHLEPLGDETRTAQPARRTAGTPAPVYHSELERLRARRERVDPTETADESAQPVARTAGQIRLDEIEYRDDERYKAAPPPQWTFFSGVFTYPWRHQSLVPWIALSIGMALCGLFGLLAVAGLTGGNRAGAVMAGFLGLAWIWLAILTGSYAAACLFAVTETTAYNFDEPHDWPDPDWRERFFHFLWIGWCLGLPVALVVTPASLIAESTQDRALMIALSTAILFPIFTLSTLETNSLSPLSGPVWSSLAREPVAWISFYLISGLILGASGWASIDLFRRLGLLALLILAPLWAACVLIYARLLGRLAWRIMRPEELQLQAWRKAHQSSLAADARQQPAEEQDPFEV